MTFVPFSVIYSALNTVHALEVYHCDNSIHNEVRQADNEYGEREQVKINSVLLTKMYNCFHVKLGSEDINLFCISSGVVVDDILISCN